MREKLRETLRRIAVWLRCRGHWCDACQLGSISVPHVCPQKRRHGCYIDEENRIVQFGRIVGAVEGPPKRKAVTVRKRPRPHLAPAVQQESEEAEGR